MAKKLLRKAGLEKIELMKKIMIRKSKIFEKIIEIFKLINNYK